MADYIERQAAIEEARYRQHFYEGHRDYDFAEAFELMGDRLEDLPSADVKPVVRGKWLTVENTMWCGGGYWKCSNCDQGFGFAAFFEADSWQFCPNCGADMRGSDNG